MNLLEYHHYYCVVVLFVLKSHVCLAEGGKMTRHEKIMMSMRFFCHSFSQCLFNESFSVSSSFFSLVYHDDVEFFIVNECVVCAVMLLWSKAARFVFISSPLSHKQR